MPKKKLLNTLISLFGYKISENKNDNINESKAQEIDKETIIDKYRVVVYIKTTENHIRVKI